MTVFWRIFHKDYNVYRMEFEFRIGEEKTPIQYIKLDWGFETMLFYH